VFVAYAVMALAACSVAPVVFTPLEEAPLEDAPPVVTEDCDVAGDEDGNGSADCQDPACADAMPCKSRCGDGRIDLTTGEEVDPPVSPSLVVLVNTQTCRFDFSQVPQLFCAGTCGAWGCKLKTGNPNSTAISFSLGAATAAPGLCCPNTPASMTGCTTLRQFDNRGVPLPVAVHETDLRSTHGPGQSISNVMCAP
jgi:hypothetical protein